MPRKKGDKAKEAKARIAKPLSQMEQEIKQTQLENDMLEKTLKQKRKHLEELAAVKAQERLLLSDAPAEEEQPEEEPEVPEARRRFMSPRGVQREQEEALMRAENFDKTLEGFQQTDGKVHVYRLKDGIYCKMSVIEAKEWTDGLEGIAKRFGGGTFKVRLHAPDGTFAGETVQHFDEEAYPKPSERPQPLIMPQAPDMTPMLRMIQEQAAQSRSDMMEMMKSMTTMIASMNKPTNPLVGNINELMMFKEMMSDKKNPASELGTLVSVLQKGMELGQASAPVEEGGIFANLLGKILNGDTLAKVATALTPLAQPQAEAPVAPPAQAPAPRQLPPPPAPQAPAKPQTRQNPPQKKQEDGKMNLVVAMYKPQIIGLAQKNEAPKKVAEQIVARIAAINDGWLIIVDDAIKIPGTKEKFVYAYAPELKAYDKWVTTVMKEMSAAIKRLVDEAAAEAAAEEEAKKPKPEPEAP